MCGIHFTLLPSSSPASPSPAITARISQRGPDHLHTHRAEHPPSSHTLTFTSSVLSLRGPPRHPLTRQPLTDAATGSVLCWNGEAWRIAGTPLDPGVNDAQEVFRLLLRGHTDVPGVLQSVEGPWAMVYWDAPAATLWYGRDVLGRRSLLWRRLQAEGAVEIASVGDGAPAWEEVGVLGLCWVGVGGGDSGVVPWVWKGEEVGTGRYMRMPFGKLDTGVTDADAETGPTEEEVQAFGRLLKQSVHTRVRDIPPPPQGGVRLAVLFSGGLDCTVLARLAHDSLPPGEPIDLLNVAFENPRVIDARRKHHNHNTEDPYELCPDRITGRRSHAELTQVCPGREWRLVAINVPLHTLREHRDTIVSLMHPHNTEMDLSIAAAFYFASRGASAAYTTPARTLLSGLGADELLGGYARHATAFRRGGAAGLAAELQTDVARLGRRNLGRDDRVLAHWGREARYPFLDEAVVAWCVCARIGGKRDKGLLRALAAAVGLPRVAAEPKRAVQFGSRSARMQGGRVKGTMQLAV